MLVALWTGRSRCDRCLSKVCSDEVVDFYYPDAMPPQVYRFPPRLKRWQAGSASALPKLHPTRDQPALCHNSRRPLGHRGL